MEERKKLILRIIHYSSIGIILIGSLLILLSFNKDFIFYQVKGNISPANFIEEAGFGNVLTILIWISVFFPFSNAILHFVTSPARIIKNNILSWVFSPIVAFFGFLQMAVSIFIGLVLIFGGLANTLVFNQIIGIILIFLSILIFGFFGMRKKPHESRTSSNRLVINNSRTSFLTFLYIFIIYISLKEVSLEGFIWVIWGSVICMLGSFGEFITEEILYPPKKIPVENHED